ncbi:hypothetical protein [Saccharothrix sp. NRRL B-16348]|uniref:hypothetical protein n=1 Tax=Saccharothrix sp. NRRL B-16348 TaxID=1415542 RepID=UPI0012FBCE57|nr:hypothetical protein [Saccharothrix sp. NRRL B-16348]
MGRKLLLAAAALVVVAGIGVAGVRFGQLNDRVAQQDVRAGQLERALRIAADPCATRAVLQDRSGDAVAVLLSVDDAAAIVPTDLPPNDAARQIYVVWDQHAGACGVGHIRCHGGRFGRATAGVVAGRPPPRRLRDLAGRRPHGARASVGRLGIGPGRPRLSPG